VRNAVIGLFPGQVLKDKERGGGDGHPEAADGAVTSSPPAPRACARVAELRPARKRSGCWDCLVTGWEV